MNGPPTNNPVKIAIRVAILVNFPLLFLSGTFWVSLPYAGVFVAEITVTNKTNQTILVTPVGTPRSLNGRCTLPTYLGCYIPIHSTQRGGFEIPPGDTLSIVYDMDDISCSEIVVHGNNGLLGQMDVSQPSYIQVVIDDLNSLQQIAPAVSRVVYQAQVPSIALWIELSIMFGPWIVHLLLFSIDRFWANPHRSPPPLPSSSQDQ